jgi:D-3-phosphoglycerate dehydrogenase / 2-oxoglutarate reductase
MRAGEWSRFHFKAHELRGKKLGLVGFGGSAQILASLVRPLEMPVGVYSPRYRGGDENAGIEACSSLDELLPRVDILSLHCPLNVETRKMINASSIARMRKGAWIINTSRGGLIDEAAMIDALRSGQLGGAALDVHESEPMPQIHPLFAMKNVVLTPHVSGASIQSTARAHAQAARNVLAALDGKDIDPRMIVNTEVLRRV